MEGHRVLIPGAALCRTNGVVLSNLWENGQSYPDEDMKERGSFGNHCQNECFNVVLCFSASQGLCNNTGQHGTVR